MHDWAPEASAHCLNPKLVPEVPSSTGRFPETPVLSAGLFSTADGFGLRSKLCTCVFVGSWGSKAAAPAGGWGSVDSSAPRSLGERAGGASGERPGDRTLESLALEDVDKAAMRRARATAGLLMAIV